MNIIELLSVS